MVTFLLTDVVGSTRLWEERPAEMAAALADHDALLAETMKGHGGELIKSRGEGDATFNVFDDPSGALAAALDAHRGLKTGLIRIRVAIHTGHAEERDGDFFGPTVNRCARLKGAAHGGQTVVSLVTRQLTHDRLPPGATLLDLGTHHLRDLTEPEHVFQLCHPDLDADFPPLASLDSKRHNLPSALTTFIGRAEELANLARALDANRFVTLVGPGGVGKTRLALEAAASRVDHHEDGVWLSELSAITDADQVAGQIAASLGVREEPGRSLDEILAKHLSDKHLLLVLDNCEHVIDAAASLTELVLKAGRDTRVLTTSREPLGITGETTVHVQGLSVPEDTAVNTSEAVALFNDRAAHVNPELSMSPIDRHAMVEICRRLDGLPLGIELAAALVDRMSVSEIANRLIERFELLTTGSRTAEPRQRSLSAAIDWSYDLLDGTERDAFAALSVFIGGFDLAGAEAVVGRGAVDAVRRLVAKSLVVHGEDRYSMLESIRVYAADRLAASGRVGQVHDGLVDWARATVDEGDRERLHAEYENVLAALRWAAGRRPHDALAMLDPLGAFWELRGMWTEGRRVLDDVLGQVREAPPGGRARALHRAGSLARAQGDFDDAEVRLRESLALAEEINDDIAIERSLTDLGGLAFLRGDVDEATLHFEAALGMARAIGGSRTIAATLGNLGSVAHATGRLEEASRMFGEARAIAGALDDRLFFARVLSASAHLADAVGDPANARAWNEQALEIARQEASPAAVAATLSLLGPLNRQAGDFSLARAQLTESLDIYRDLGDRLNAANALLRLGELRRDEGAFDDAREMLEESLAMFEDLGHALGVAAVEVAIGEVERRTGDTGRAAAAFRHAIQGLWSQRHLGGVASAIEHIAAVAATHANAELAAELLGAAEGMRARIGEAEPAAADRPVNCDSLRSKLGADEFDRALARGAGLTDDEALALALASTSV